METRLDQHNSAFFDGSFSSRANDWTIYLILECNDRGHARKVEAHIKGMKSTTFIRNLKAYPEMRDRLTLRFAEAGSGWTCYI